MSVVHAEVKSMKPMKQSSLYSSLSIRNTRRHTLLHVREGMVSGDACYRGIEKRLVTALKASWHTPMCPGKRKTLDKNNAANAPMETAEKLKADVRAQVKHPHQVLKRQFGYVKVRYQGLKRNTAQMITLLARSNSWMARRNLSGAVT